MDTLLSQDFISQEYTPFEEAPINTKATYIVIGEDKLAENREALGAYFSKHPKKIHLIDALYETLDINFQQLPGNVSFLAFSNTRHNLTTVSDGFLAFCRGLRAVDLSGLANVTTIGDGFLAFSRGLRAVNVSDLANVTTIGRNFLAKPT